MPGLTWQIPVVTAMLGDDAALLGCEVLSKQASSFTAWRTPNYDKSPFVQVPGGKERCVQGWDNIATRLRQST